MADEAVEADSEVVEELLELGETELGVVAVGVIVVSAPVVDSMSVDDGDEGMPVGVEVRTGSADGEPMDTPGPDVVDVEALPVTLLGDDALEPHAAPRMGTAQVNVARAAKRRRVMRHPAAPRAY